MFLTVLYGRHHLDMMLSQCLHHLQLLRYRCVVGLDIILTSCWHHVGGMLTYKYTHTASKQWGSTPLVFKGFACLASRGNACFAWQLVVYILIVLRIRSTRSKGQPARYKNLPCRLGRCFQATGVGVGKWARGGGIVYAPLP